MPIIRPMLACAVKPHQLRFPLMATPKIDGIRAFVRDGKLLSRTGKLIPNKFIQETLAGLPCGFDGELVVGKTFQECSSGVMSVYGQPKFTYWVFDWFGPDNYTLRTNKLFYWKGHKWPQVKLHLPDFLFTRDDLLAYEERVLDWGYEGVCLRDPASPYKQGRSTLNEHYLLKLKRFADGEAEVIGVEELMHNNNPQERSELGYAKRSSHQENKTRARMLGALVVRDLLTGVEFNIGTGFTETQRIVLWHHKPIGGIVKYKHFAIGQKDKPRHPVFQGFRNKEDM